MSKSDSNFLKRILNFLKTKSFVSDVIKIMSGTLTGQIIGILSLPVITRLFSPEAFGILGVYSAIIGVLSVIVCMRYELAIVIAKGDHEAANIYWVSLVFTVFWTLITSAVVFFYSKEFSNLVNSPGLAQFLWLVPIGVFINGIHTTNSHWNTRRSKFGRLASVQISNSVVTAGSSIGFGFSGFTSGGYLIAGSLMGTISASLELGRKIWQEDRVSLFRNISHIKMAYVTKKYKNISIFNTTSSLFNSLSQGAPLVLLSLFFNPVITGYYLLGHKLLNLPVSLIGKSMQKVYYQRASIDWNKTGSIKDITSDVATVLLIISIVVITVIVSLAVPLTPIIFGSEWVVAGNYIQWLALWIVFSFISVPIGSVITIMQKEHVGLYFQILAFILRISSLLVGGMILQDAYKTIVLYSIAGMIYHISFLTWVFNKINIPIISFISSLKYLIICSIITITISYIIIDYNYGLYTVTTIVAVYLAFAIMNYKEKIKLKF
jgi:lipopolysaccharide exporter